MDSITVGDLCFEVRRSPRRKFVQITVDRGGELILSVPDGCPSPKMAAFVREKRFWIYTKLAEKAALRAETLPKRYVSGEGFPYLGRSHRLLLVDSQGAPVKLERGRFMMASLAASTGREHMVRWYTERAIHWLGERVERYRRRIGVTPVGLTVQDLGFRWGSCGNGGRLYFHWRSILLPPRIVEYVVVHELVHLIEPHHTPAFWSRVERTLPDFATRKQWLAENAARLNL